MSSQVTDDYRQRWAEAEQEARRRQDEHVRTMIVMLEKKVDALFRRCEETWTQADEQKVVIGGLLTAIDEMKTDREVRSKNVKAKFDELESKFFDGQLGE